MTRLRISDLIRFFKKADEGATMVEMALVSAILLSGVFGIIAISSALYTYDYIAEASHAGARYAIVRGAYCAGFSDCGAGNAAISAYVKGLNYPGINPNAMTVYTTWYKVNQNGTGAATTITYCGTTPGGCNVPGKNSVEVGIEYAFPLNIPFWKSTTLTMASKSQLAIAQ